MIHSSKSLLYYPCSLKIRNAQIMKPLILFSLYLVFEHCMDPALRSSLPHLTRWFNTVLGQKEVKEVMEGLDLKQCLPKVAPVVECEAESSPGNVSKGAPASVAPAKALGSSGKSRCLSPPLQSIWQQNSQACFFCFDYNCYTNILEVHLPPISLASGRPRGHIFTLLFNLYPPPFVMLQL